MRTLPALVLVLTCGMEMGCPKPTTSLLAMQLIDTAGTDPGCVLVTPFKKP